MMNPCFRHLSTIRKKTTSTVHDRPFGLFDLFGQQVATKTFETALNAIYTSFRSSVLIIMSLWYDIMKCIHSPVSLGRMLNNWKTLVQCTVQKIFAHYKSKTINDCMHNIRYFGPSKSVLITFLLYYDSRWTSNLIFFSYFYSVLIIISPAFLVIIIIFKNISLIIRNWMCKTHQSSTLYTCIYTNHSFLHTIIIIINST